MTTKTRTPWTHQRNALAPSLLAAAVLFLAPLLLAGGGTGASVVLYVTAIIAGWFAAQDRRAARGRHRVPGRRRTHQVQAAMTCSRSERIIDRTEDSGR